MLFRVDPTSSIPLFEQVASSVRSALASGEASVGERLPAARELAESLDMNVHTVLHAYQLLRDEGMVELRRGRGAILIGGAENIGALTPAVDGLVAEARRLGVSLPTLTALITKAY